MQSDHKPGHLVEVLHSRGSTSTKKEITSVSDYLKETGTTVDVACSQLSLYSCRSSSKKNVGETDNLGQWLS